VSALPTENATLNHCHNAGWQNTTALVRILRQDSLSPWRTVDTKEVARMNCDCCGALPPLQCIAPKGMEAVALCVKCIAKMRKRRIQRILRAQGCTALFGGSSAQPCVYARCDATQVRRCLGEFDALSLMSEAELCALVQHRFSMVMVK
jgi:hypothetical protein